MRTRKCAFEINWPLACKGLQCIFSGAINFFCVRNTNLVCLSESLCQLVPFLTISNALLVKQHYSRHSDRSTHAVGRKRRGSSAQGGGPDLESKSKKMQRKLEEIVWVIRWFAGQMGRSSQDGFSKKILIKPQMTITCICPHALWFYE